MFNPDPKMAGPMGKDELCIPASSLDVDGTTPEVGDSVSFTVEGTVARSEGGDIYVKPSTINGEPVEARGMDDDAEMLAMAQKADSEDYG